MAGLFISFEGGEGSGKTTQAQALVTALQEKGIDTIYCREPGSTPGGEAIRNLLVRTGGEEWSPGTEVLLFLAARRDNLEKVIRPALEQGKVVVCDRFCDSTMVYQGHVRGLNKGSLKTLFECAYGNQEPDLTFYLSVSPEVGLRRALSRPGVSSEENRYESKGLEFHQKIYEGYEWCYEQNQDRMYKISTDSMSIQTIQALVLAKTMIELAHVKDR